MASNVLDKIWDLLFKPGEAEAYQEDPQAYLEEHDLNECTPEQVNEAVSMAYEKGPVSQGASVNVGGNQSVGQGSAPPPPASPPPPPPMDPTLPAAEALEQTVNYYVTNVTETNVDDRDTYTDSSVNTNVLAEEGADVDIDIDTDTTVASGDGAAAVGGDNEGVINTGENTGVIAEDSDLDGVAVGEGAVAAGEDINAPVNTGEFTGIQADESTFDGVAVGDGNTVISDSTNVATGGGSVSDDDVDVDIVSAGDVSLDDVNFGQGNTIDESINTEYNDSFNTTNTDSFNTTDSFNQDNDVTTTNETNVISEYENSFNTASVISDESFNTDSAIADDYSTAEQTAPAEEELDV